jgi:hypothetical protein
MIRDFNDIMSSADEIKSSIEHINQPQKFKERLKAVKVRTINKI